MAADGRLSAEETISATILPHFKIAHSVRSPTPAVKSFSQIPVQKASPKMWIPKIFSSRTFCLRWIPIRGNARARTLSVGLPQKRTVWLS